MCSPGSVAPETTAPVNGAGSELPLTSRRAWTTGAIAEGLALACVIGTMASLRAGLLQVPLERDEGDYALGGQLLLEGQRLYRDFYTMRWPGIYAAYAGILSVFGRSTISIHTALLIMHAATTALVYATGRKLYGAVCGLSAAALFGISSSVAVLLGHTANSEHFINFYALAAIALLISNDRARAWQCAAGGMLLGIAFVTKQHAGALVVVGWACLVMFGRVAPPYSRALFRPTAIYFAGAAVPVAAALACILIWGGFDQFRIWTIDYARAYSGQVSVRDGWTVLRFELGLMAPILWPVAILSIAGVVAGARDRKSRWAFVFVMLYLGASVMMVSLGLYFRPHYFLFLCPPVALLGGKGLQAICDRLRPIAPVPVSAGVIVVVMVAFVVFGERAYFFQYTPAEASRVRNGVNPFPESEEIAKYIASRTAPDDRILVLGSEPQIYFYARRRNATAHVHMYPLMENQPFAARMQEELIEQTEAAKPVYAVFVPVSMSWLQGPYSDERIFHWFADYARRHYTLEAVLDVPESGVGELRPAQPIRPLIDDVPRIQIYRWTRD